MVDLRWLGLQEFTHAITATTARMEAASRSGVVKAAAKLERQAKRNASGRPGPEVVTGTLRRGIRTWPVTRWAIGGWQTQVAPTVIYSRRVELGFHSSDRLGRHYDQPGYPFFSPAFDAVREELPRIYAEEWAKAITG